MNRPPQTRAGRKQRLLELSKMAIRGINSPAVQQELAYIDRELKAGYMERYLLALEDVISYPLVFWISEITVGIEKLFANHLLSQSDSELPCGFILLFMHKLANIRKWAAVCVKELSRSRPNIKISRFDDEIVLYLLAQFKQTLLNTDRDSILNFSNEPAVLWYGFMQCSKYIDPQLLTSRFIQDNPDFFQLACTFFATCKLEQQNLTVLIFVIGLLKNADRSFSSALKLLGAIAGNESSLMLSILDVDVMVDTLAPLVAPEKVVCEAYFDYFQMLSKIKAHPILSMTNLFSIMQYGLKLLGHKDNLEFCAATLEDAVLVEMFLKSPLRSEFLKCVFQRDSALMAMMFSGTADSLANVEACDKVYQILIRENVYDTGSEESRELLICVSVEIAKLRLFAFTGEKDDDDSESMEFARAMREYLLQFSARWLNKMSADIQFVLSSHYRDTLKKTLLAKSLIKMALYPDANLSKYAMIYLSQAVTDPSFHNLLINCLESICRDVCESIASFERNDIYISLDWNFNVGTAISVTSASLLVQLFTSQVNDVQDILELRSIYAIGVLGMKIMLKCKKQKINQPRFQSAIKEFITVYETLLKMMNAKSLFMLRNNTGKYYLSPDVKFILDKTMHAFVIIAENSKILSAAVYWNAFLDALQVSIALLNSRHIFPFERWMIILDKGMQGGKFSAEMCESLRGFGIGVPANTILPPMTAKKQPVTEEKQDIEKPPEPKKLKIAAEVPDSNVSGAKLLETIPEKSVASSTRPKDPRIKLAAASVQETEKPDVITIDVDDADGSPKQTVKTAAGSKPVIITPQEKDKSNQNGPKHLPKQTSMSSYMTALTKPYSPPVLQARPVFISSPIEKSPSVEDIAKHFHQNLSAASSVSRPKIINQLSQKFSQDSSKPKQAIRGDSSNSLNSSSTANSPLSQKSSNSQPQTAVTAALTQDEKDENSVLSFLQSRSGEDNLWKRIKTTVGELESSPASAIPPLQDSSAHQRQNNSYSGQDSPSEETNSWAKTTVDVSKQNVVVCVTSSDDEDGIGNRKESSFDKLLKDSGPTRTKPRAQQSVAPSVSRVLEARDTHTMPKTIVKQVDDTLYMSEMKKKIDLSCVAFYRKVLVWQMDDLLEREFSKKPVVSESTVPLDYVTTDDYRKSMEPHIFREVAAQLVRGFEDGVTYTETLKMKLLSLNPGDDFVLLTFRFDQLGSQPFDIVESDILCIFLNENDRITSFSRELWNLIKDSLIVKFLAKNDKANFDPTNVGVGSLCLRVSLDSGNVHFMDQLLPGSEWFAVKLQNMSSMEREFHSLQCLDLFPLKNDILRPTRARLNPISPLPVLQNGVEKLISGEMDILNNYMHKYSVNLSQAKAILSSVRQKEGFVLIQGPPGTGKTTTIIGIVSALLSLRPNFNQGHLINLSRKDLFKTSSEHILICAPSNAAVDELVRRFRASAKTNNVNIIRLGTLEGVHESVRDMTLDQLVDNRLSNDTEYNRILKDNSLFTDRKQLEELKFQIRQKYDKRDAMEAALPSHATENPEIMALEEEIDMLGLQKAKLWQHILKVLNNNNTNRRVLDAARNRLKLQVLNEADVILSTLSMSGNETLLSGIRNGFDTVIIDEACQAVEPSTFIPLKFNCKKCILVGDPKQLPPTVLSTESQRLGYDSSLFNRLQAKLPVIMLATQYRMHPDISQFPNRAFYQSQLEDFTKLRQSTARPWHADEMFRPYMFFNLRHSQEQSNKKSVYNSTECEAAIRLYARLKSQYPQLSLRGKVGVITPYREQKRRLAKSFDAQFKSDLVQVNTIDGFQGQEKDVIIFSCVRSNAEGNMGFLSDIRRLNVAMTRAKCSLWIIGDAQSLQTNDCWRQMLENASDRGLFYDLEIPPSTTIDDPDDIFIKIKRQQYQLK